MGKAMEAIGSDGFLISTPFQRISRRYVTEVCEGFVPALQRRGLARRAYTKNPAARHAAQVLELASCAVLSSDGRVELAIGHETPLRWRWSC